MATITQHAPGSFCWIELASTDQNAARKFYSKLFGWNPNEMPIGEGQTYTIFQLGGRDAAALQQIAAPNFPPGTPSHWLAYLAVENVDDSAKRVQASGGQVMAPPFDVMDQGRMAVGQDPLGAMFAMWQPGKSPGLGVTTEPNSLAWCQLNAPMTGADKAKGFYGGAFGWGFRDDPMPMGMSYTTWMAGSERRGGMMPMPPGTEAPASWLVYFASDDVDDTTGTAIDLGANPMVPPTDIPGVGRFAVLQDPQGAFFALVKFSGPM
jgi:hypothetical protein